MMSRSNYTDDCDGFELARWRGAVSRSIKGRRGQALLRDLGEALDAMPVKRLYPGSFASEDGEFCALGALAAHKGIRTDDLGSDEGDDCDPDRVAERFGISGAMAAEIMWANDEGLVSEHAYIDGRWSPDPDHAEKRWLAMKQWVSKMLIEAKGGA